MFNGNAFVSCHYKYDKWCNVAIFERLCGFKPHAQRDPEKMLKKTIFNAVETIDNTPVSGFSFVDFNKDLYGLYYHSYNCTDIVLQDPRGFNVAITAENFWNMMKCAGMNMKDGKIIDHKFAYAWIGNGSRFLIVDAESDDFVKCKAESDKYKDKIDNKRYLTKKQLEVGKTYLGSELMKGKYVYLGEMPIYETYYHENALKNKAYEDIEKYVIHKEYGDKTAVSRLVFYKLDDAYTPFCFLSSISKKIEKEIDEDLSQHKMHDDNEKCVSLTAIQEIMTTSLQFNKIDLNTVKDDNLKLYPFEDFKAILNYSYGHNNDFDASPYCDMYANYCKLYVDSHVEVKDKLHASYMPSAFNSQHLYLTGYCKIRKEHDRISNCLYYCNDFVLANVHDDKVAYDLLQPKVIDMKYENGKDVPSAVIAVLQLESGLTSNNSLWRHVF